MRLKLASLLVLSVALIGCPDDTSSGDAGTDVRVGRDADPGTDTVRFDTAPDSETDAEADASGDTEPDTPADAPEDAVEDVVEDSERDALEDSEGDALEDVAEDAPEEDVELDLPIDAKPDTPTDVVPDTTPDVEPDVDPGCSSVTDIDGNTYSAVEIGSQCWMASNLRTTRAADGSSVTRWCCNCDLYGGMYDWANAMNGSAGVGAQGVCPDGWHLPSDADWFTLESFIEPSLTDPGFIGWNETTIGTQLSASGPYGFDWGTAGFSYGGDGCNFADDRVLYWTSSDYSVTQAVSRLFNTAFTGTNRDYREKSFGFYIRCVKD